MDYQYVMEKSEILELLKEFRADMPRLEEKVGSYEKYAEKLADSAIIITATDKGEYAGFIIFYSNDAQNETGFISLLLVNEKYRRQHIGSGLISEAENVMRDAGMKTVQLYVEQENYCAINFYLRLGFQDGDVHRMTSRLMMKRI